MQLRVHRNSFDPRRISWVLQEKGSTNQIWIGERGDEKWMLKWYRYPMEGVHPEVEMAQVLEQTGIDCIARYGGVLEGRLKHAEWKAIAFVQRWVEGESLWDFVVNMMRCGDFPEQEVKSWGMQIGKLHKALREVRGNSAFSPEGWSALDADRWSKRVESCGDRILEHLKKKRPDEVTCSEWERAKLFWEGREKEWRAKALALSELCVEQHKIRIHGDLHLGQILRTSEKGIVLLDFEGEPLRSLEERREKDSPMRDVAGMLRSFAYAEAVSEASIGESKRWGDAFLAGWENEMVGESGLQHDVLEAFVWEKAVYELEYELRHRPKWIGVPLNWLEQNWD